MQTSPCIFLLPETGTHNPITMPHPNADHPHLFSSTQILLHLLTLQAVEPQLLPASQLSFHSTRTRTQSSSDKDSSPFGHNFEPSANEDYNGLKLIGVKLLFRREKVFVFGLLFLYVEPCGCHWFLPVEMKMKWGIYIEWRRGFV